MELNWLQSLAFGLVSGLTDILPVSSQAHQKLLLTFFGETGTIPVTRLVTHAAAFVTVLVCVWGQLGRIRRAQQTARMPRRRRNRPVDMTALMDGKILTTAMIPTILVVLLGGAAFRTVGLPGLAVLCLVNAAVLYLPGVFPTADKDSRLVTPLEGLFMGLGAGVGAIPGMSSVGMSYSLGVLHGIDRQYMVHLSLLMHLVCTAGMMVFDVLDLVKLASFQASAADVIAWGAAALATAAGTLAAVRMLRGAAGRGGLTRWSFYSFGLALTAFIIYLMV